jgi:hypothetical protein
VLLPIGVASTSRWRRVCSLFRWTRAHAGHALQTMPTKCFHASKLSRHRACLAPFCRRGLSQYGLLHALFGQFLGFCGLRGYQEYPHRRHCSSFMCIYVRYVDGEHYADIAAVLRPFHSVREEQSEEELIRKGRLKGDPNDGRRTRRFKRDIQGDSVRIADTRYKKDYPQKYAALERAVREYHGRPKTARGQYPPHYELLLLAHQCLGNITAEQSSLLQAVAQSPSASK